MAAVVLVLRPDRDGVIGTARRALTWLEDAGHQVRLPEGDAARLDRSDLATSQAQLTDGVDLAVSLGGDGTMLRTVHLVASAGIPVLGVNHGQLGYLTQVDPTGLEEALAAYFAGRHQIEERMMLRVRTDAPASGVVLDAVALNEAVIEKTDSGRTVRLQVSFDGATFTRYTADGLIVATPTGSTAYSFSVRGPIVAPTHRAMLLTPVSPHMLFDRSLVLEPHDVLRVEVASERTASLALDGVVAGTLQEGDAVECTAAGVPARLVVFGPRDFHRLLKQKFGLPDR